MFKTSSINYIKQTILFFIILFLLTSFSLNNIASAGKGKLLIVVDIPGSWVYLNDIKKGMIGDEGFANILAEEGEYLLFIEKPTANSKYSYSVKREVFVGEGSLIKLNLRLKYGFSKAEQKRWDNNRQTILNKALASLEMVDIPAGDFIMGSDDGGRDEKPPHRVTLSAFQMAKNETTFALYDLFVIDTGYILPDDEGWGRGNRPVINVTWFDTQEFIKWLNKVSKTNKPYRLPTEAEWEYAARAGTTTKYWWGDNPGLNIANYNGSKSQWSFTKTAPTGSFAANPFGLNDTVGNVWEWVQDWYDSYYYQNSPINNPTGPLYGSFRVFRDGSWLNDANYARSTNRHLDSPYDSYNHLGFRLARSR